MRLIIAVEIEPGENYSAEAPFTESDLLRTPGKLAQQFAEPMFAAILKGFEEDMPTTAAGKRERLERGVKRGIEFYRARKVKENALERA